jgi:aryl-alcohol dehydrogenase-like predicted oxidoreductase
VATKTPPMSGKWPPSPYDKAEDRYPEKYLRENIEQRLKNLQSDCLDILQLHTWTSAWNKDPKPLDTLKKLQAEGKIRYIGVSTPEQDQNCVVDLMRRGYLDTVQVIYNIFEQEPAASLLPTALECNVGIIVRVVFDEGVLTGKYKADSKFPEGDFRNRYFAGDRLERAVKRTDKIKDDIKDSGLTMPQVSMKFVLADPAVSTVIPGIRNVQQAQDNAAVSDLPPLSDAIVAKLREHAWLRSHWYSGK